VPTLGGPTPTDPGDPVTHCEILPSGMTLLIDETHVSPIVALALWVRSGAADEADEHSGVSHFLEHMLLKDSGGDISGTLAGIVQDAGGYMNARTGLDHTAFYQVVPSRSWRDVLASVHSTLEGASFAEEDVRSERRVIMEEAKRAERDPSVFVMRRLMETAFPGSGYGRPIVGTERSVGAVDAGVLSRWLSAVYSPSNMVQVVVGDVDAAAVAEFARDLDQRPPVSGPIPAADASALRWSPARRVYFGDLRQPYVAVGFRAPAVGHDDMPALDAMCGLMGLGRSSRLRRSLRTSLGLVSDIGATAVGHRDVGTVVVRALGMEGSSPARIVEEAFRQIRLIKEEPVSGTEAAKSIRRLEAGYALEHETVETMAMSIGYSASVGDHRYAEEYVDRLAAVTPDDIMRVANLYLDADEAAIAAYLPERMRGEGGSRATEREIGGSAASGDRRATGESVAVPIPGTGPREGSTEWGSAAGFSRPAIVRETPDAALSRVELAGGATLVVRETPGTPLVSVAMGFRGGFTDEPDGSLGLTALTLKHLMRGTATRSADRLADEVEGLGSGISTSVDRDGFGVGLTVLSPHLEQALSLLGEAVAAPALSDYSIESVKAEAIADVGASEDHPIRRTMRRLMPLLFPAHVYGRPIGGTRATLSSIQAGATREWHARHMVAERLTVCVAGGVSVERARDALRESVSGIGRGSREEGVVAPPPRPRGRIEEELGRKGQSCVAVGFPGPRVGTDDAVALHAAASALTMMGGRLWRALRERPPFAYSVRAVPIPLRAGGAVVGLVTTPPDQEEHAVETFVREFDDLAGGGLTEAELARGKRYLAGLMEISMQRGAARAAGYAAAEVAGVGHERVERLPDLVRDVTMDDVVRAASLYVTAEDEPAVAILRG